MKMAIILTFLLLACSTNMKSNDKQKYFEANNTPEVIQQIVVDNHKEIVTPSQPQNTNQPKAENTEINPLSNRFHNMDSVLTEP